jgi:hypothetical protein
MSQRTVVAHVIKEEPRRRTRQSPAVAEQRREKRSTSTAFVEDLFERAQRLLATGEVEEDWSPWGWFAHASVANPRTRLSPKGYSAFSADAPSAPRS